MTLQDFQDKKTRKEKLVMLTAYDYPTAHFMDQAGIDIILVGDSLANVVLGLESTREVGMAEMLHHAGAVARAVKKAFTVGDMPYCAYQPHPQAAVDNARQFMAVGCKAVKLEWFDGCAQVAKQIITAGIPVMGHVGLTPQTAEDLGGLKVQGKDAKSAGEIITQAKALEKAGCFCIVLECIPQEIAKIITGSVSVPTIGIGAGIHCDGQVLVTHDLLGYGGQFQPKFTKQYAHIGRQMSEAIKDFCVEVKKGKFPDEKHSYHIKAEELKSLKVS